VLIAAIGVASLILFRHRANIRRIASGTERRMGAPR
jgi:glycerol-3-phosphate acyltransferase PlsY